MSVNNKQKEQNMKVTEQEKQAAKRLCDQYRRPNGTVDWVQMESDKSSDWQVATTGRSHRNMIQLAMRNGFHKADGKLPKYAKNRHRKYYIPAAERRRRAALAAQTVAPVVHVSTGGGGITAIQPTAGPKYCPECGHCLIGYGGK